MNSTVRLISFRTEALLFPCTPIPFKSQIKAYFTSKSNEIPSYPGILLSHSKIMRSRLDQMHLDVILSPFKANQTLDRIISFKDQFIHFPPPRNEAQSSS